MMKKKLLWLWQTFLAPSPLRRKFLRAFLIVGLVPLLLMGFLAIYLLNLIHRIDINALERNLAEQTAIEIKRTVDEISDNVNLEVTTPASLSVPEQQFILERILERNSALTALAFVCTKEEFCAPGFETSRITRGSPAAPPESTDYRESPSYEPASRGELRLGPVVSGRDGKSSLVAIAGPVVNKNKEVISILTGTFQLAPIQTIIARNQLGETGYVYLADDSGMIIAHPDPKYLGKNIKNVVPTESAGSGRQGGFAKGEFYKSLAGEMVSGAISEVTGKAADLGWKVVAEWPRRETQSVVVNMIWNVARFAGGALLLILIFGGLMTSGLIRPIAALKQGVQSIGQGNFDYRFRLGTHDELEELGERLNLMAGDLKKLQEFQELQVRTQALAESLRREQELSGLKDQFVRTVSHQFNTPLSVIHWALEMVNGPEASPQTIKEGLASINQSRKDILAMVDNLLTLSEIGFRYQKANVKPVDLRKLVGDAIGKLHEDVSAKNLTITFRENGADFTARVNEFALGKVIQNLISNAVTYSQERGKIEIALNAEGQKITFKIADQGIGIPAEDQKRIFEQFFRASNAIDKKNVGTGVGLFIVRTIVEGHGGKVWFESKKDEGATFYFTVPR